MAEGVENGYSGWQGNMWNRSLVFAGNPEGSVSEAERRASRGCLWTLKISGSVPLE